MTCPPGWVPPPRPLIDAIHRVLPGVWSRMAEDLRSVRTVGRVDISSWYRDPERNRACGGVGNSLHLRGLALDLTGPGAVEAAEQLRARGWQEIIVYPSGRVHAGLLKE